MTIHRSIVAANAAATSLNTAIGNAALIQIFTGSMPASPDVATSGTMLASFTGGSPFGVVANGLLTASPIPFAIAATSGTAGYLRISTSGGVGVLDLDIGASGSAVTTNTSTAISKDAAIQLSGLVISEL